MIAPTAADAPEILPEHIEQTVQAIARLHAEHHRNATPLQRLVDRTTAVVAHPSFIVVVTIAALAWIGGNLLAVRLVGMRFDSPAFPWLQGAGELAAIYITTLVLMSQRRKDELSELREQLMLELAIMSEQKGSKIIALIEELRCDNPLIVNRVDPQADAMSTPADPMAMSEAVKETQEDMIAAADGTGAEA